ncbi:MAG: hypothetical protein ACK4ZS_01725 [Sulfurimicrobium sp.]
MGIILSCVHNSVASIAEIAAHERIEKVWVQKMLRLARLAPDVVEDVARGRQPVGLSLEFFMRQPLPDGWEAQRDRKPAWLQGVIRRPTCARTGKREEFGGPVGRNRHILAIIGIRINRATAGPARGDKKASARLAWDVWWCAVYYRTTRYWCQ